MTVTNRLLLALCLCGATVPAARGAGHQVDLPFAGEVPYSRPELQRLEASTGAAIDSVSAEDRELHDASSSFIDAFLTFYQRRREPGADEYRELLGVTAPSQEPNLRSVLTMARLVVLVLDVIDLEQAGTGHFDLFRALLAFSRGMNISFGCEGRMTHRMTWIAVELGALRQLARHVRRHPLSVDECELYARELRRHLAMLRGFADSVQDERRTVARDVDILMGSTLSPAHGASVKHLLGVRWFPEGVRTGAVSALHRLFDRALEALELPVVEARAEMGRLHDEARAIERSPPSWMRSLFSPVRTASEAIAALLFPHLPKDLERDLTGRAWQQGAEILLHLECAKARDGAYPKDLDVGLPRDPFSGEAFVYRLRDGGPVLYSVGTDGVDDGGDERSDIVLR